MGAVPMFLMLVHDNNPPTLAERSNASSILEFRMLNVTLYCESITLHFKFYLYVKMECKVRLLIIIMNVQSENEIYFELKFEIKNFK